MKTKEKGEKKSADGYFCYLRLLKGVKRVVGA